MHYKKTILATVGAATLLMLTSQAHAGRTLQKTYWDTAFNYTNTNCKNNGFPGGMVNFGSSKGNKNCVKSANDLRNWRRSGTKSYNRTVSATNYLVCGNRNQSCSQSFSTGKNSCKSVSTTISAGVSVSATLSGGIGTQFVSGGVTKTVSSGWARTTGKSYCSTSNVTNTCTIGPGKKVRLEMKAKEHDYTANIHMKGEKLRRQVKQYINTRRDGSRYTTKEYGAWKAYKANFKTFNNGVKGRLPVSRFTKCAAKNR